MKKIIIFILLSLSCFYTTFAQWQTDVRLTNALRNSVLSWNVARCIASSGNFVHVVWFDYRDFDFEIYYKRSTDAGVSWGADIRLTNQPANSHYPALSVSGLAVHVVWQEERAGNREIYYKRSTDAGVSWGADTRLSNNDSTSQFPSVTASGSGVHVVWYDWRDGNWEIYYKRSTDGGSSWGAETRMTNDSNLSAAASIAVSGQVVHLVWNDSRDIYNIYEIYYKRSTDGGTSWSADTRITTIDNYESSRTSIDVSGSVVHIVWEDWRNVTEIYYIRSTDGGLSWGAETRLTNFPNLSAYPSVSVSGSAVHVVWYDFRNGGTSEIYYKCSTDGGVSWGADTRLTNDPAISERPSVSVSGSVVHVVWDDNRDTFNFEIYYKRDPTGNSVGLNQSGTEIPKEYSLYNNYPNPFNPVTKIRFDIPLLRGVDAEGGRGVLAKLIIYDILGREVAALVNEQLQPGKYEAEWDGTNYPSGIYYYTIKTTAFSQTKKMVLIK